MIKRPSNYATVSCNNTKEKKPQPKVICADCNILLDIYCDNDCGTLTCHNCNNNYYINSEKDIVVKGHNPNCGMSAEPIFDQFQRWLPKTRAAPIINKKTGCVETNF